EDGQTWTYCHLAVLDPQVTDGVSLTAGTQVGLVGMTGPANGPHPHLSRPAVRARRHAPPRPRSPPPSAAAAPHRLAAVPAVVPELRGEGVPLAGRPDPARASGRSARAGPRLPRRPGNQG